jgi:hypothetical protein
MCPSRHLQERNFLCDKWLERRRPCATRVSGLQNNSRTMRQRLGMKAFPLLIVLSTRSD